MKNANGDGGISYEASRDKYRAYYTTPAGQRVRKRFDTMQEAKQWLVSVKAEVYNGDFVEPSNVTVGSWILEFLDNYAAPRVRPKTFTRYLQTAKHLEPIAGVLLQKLNATQVQKFYNNAQVSDNLKVKMHKLLKAAYTKAYNLGMVKRNIMVNVEPPVYHQKEIEIFSQAEIGTLLKYLAGSRYYNRYLLFFSLAVATGARLGELLGLKLKEVKADRIVINNSLQDINGQLVDMPPKTKAGYREITIGTKMAAELRASATGKVLNYNQYVFQTRNGTPWAPRNIERTWKKVLENAGIAYKRFHSLRHTHATQLLANGVPLLEVSKRLGHAKPSHTLVLYGHSIKGYDEKIPEKVEKIFFS